MDTIEKWDRVTIDGTLRGTVVQDGVQKSLVSTRRSDGEPGEQRDWYANERLEVYSRRTEMRTGGESDGVKFY